MTEWIDEGVGRRPVPYAEGLALQARLHDEVVAGRAPDTVLLLEHEAVYTAGKRTEAHERPVDAGQPGATPVIDVDRGGKITWHGPGQLVGYPIVRLPDPVDVVAYVRSLEAMLIEVVGVFGVRAFRVEGRSGVWVHVPGLVPGTVAEAKLGAIGVRVAGGVTTHGFALNCSNPLEPYSRIVACGIRDAGVTTLSEVLGVRIEPRDVVDEVRARFVAPREAALAVATVSDAAVEMVPDAAATVLAAVPSAAGALAVAR